MEGCELAGFRDSNQVPNVNGVNFPFVTLKTNPAGGMIVAFMTGVMTWVQRI